MGKEGNKIKVTEAAKILNVDRKTVLDWIERGFLRAYRPAEGCMWLIDRDDVEQVLVPSIPIESEGPDNEGKNAEE